MTPEFLGYQHTDQGWRPAWVIWLDDPTCGLGPQLPGTFTCGHCRAVRPLTHLVDRPDLQDPIVRSLSVSCACRASVHFDLTPEAERASLQWTTRFAPRLPEPAEAVEGTR